jgi:hypothetical protein
MGTASKAGLTSLATMASAGFKAPGPDEEADEEVRSKTGPWRVAAQAPNPAGCTSLAKRRALRHSATKCPPTCVPFACPEQGPTRAPSPSPFPPWQVQDEPAEATSVAVPAALERSMVAGDLPISCARLYQQIHSSGSAAIKHMYQDAVRPPRSDAVHGWCPRGPRGPLLAAEMAS